MNTIPTITNSAASSSNAEPLGPVETPEITGLMIYALTVFAGIALYYSALRIRAFRLSQSTPPTITPQTPESSRREIERRVDEWVQEREGNPAGSRISDQHNIYIPGPRTIAQSLIIKFLNNEISTQLSIMYLELSTLPRIWSYPQFSRLKTLDLNESTLTEFPEDICDLTSLRSLCLRCNRLTTFPAQISRLTNLENLAISCNSIQSVPPEIGILTSLRVLSLTATELTSLPNEICYLTNLRVLQLSPVRSLPPQVTLLTNLEILKFEPTVRPPIWFSLFSLIPFQLMITSRDDLLTNYNALINNIIDSWNPLRRSVGAEICQMENLKALAFSNTTSLPSEIGQLTNLQSLELINCELMSIPREVGRLTSLRQLYCRGNATLRELPNEIMDLSSDCTISLSNNGFTLAILNNIRNFSAAPDYQGPHFDISIRENNPQIPDNLSVKKLLKKLYKEIGETYVPLKNIPGPDVDLGSLQAWLTRLYFMKDFNCGPDSKKWMINNIIKYLKLADEDQSYRKDFGAIIVKAAVTCGDRVAYSCLQLDIAYQLTKIDLRDMKKLANFLVRGFWAMSMLENIARDKIATLICVDQIEAFLAYPVKLRERLNLPINIKDMLYFRFSGVTQDDLNEAYQVVTEKLNDRKAYLEFLATRDKWQESLKVNYPTEFTAIERTRTDQSERALPDEDYNLILATYIQSLVELTATALEEADGSAASSSSE